MKIPVTSLAMLLVVACSSSDNFDEILVSDASADSAENIIAINMRRAQRAEDSLEDYRLIADELETELIAQRRQIRQQRDKLGRNAKQIEAQKKEIAKLENEAAALQKSKGELAATIASEKKLVTEARAELRRQEEVRRDWSAKLQTASALHDELKVLIEPLLARLPAPELQPEPPKPEPEQASPAEQKTTAKPVEQKAPAKPAPKKPAAPAKKEAKAPAKQAPAK